MLIAVVAGVLSWTLVEYLLHRCLGHDVRTRPNAFADEHTRHHAVGDYFAPLWKKAAVALAALVLIAPVLGVPFAASFVGMYAAYELVHRRLHTHRGVGPYGRALRRHHFHHHFVDPKTNHGVTSPFWDVVFGTRARAGRIRVPAKLCMRWLIDDATNDIVPELRPFYELAR